MRPSYTPSTGNRCALEENQNKGRKKTWIEKSRMDVHHQLNHCNQRNKHLFLNCNIVFPMSDLLDLVLLYKNEGLK